ncbi:MAG: class II glutamine amidotransferase [Candidatus Micrarchaeota archaeon]|nr:class II glutamine amidotransferase [Candidatus Micrarchaeota archaeon]
MGFIAYLPSQEIMSSEEIERVWKRNEDGAGIAFFEEETNSWRIIKGIMQITDLKELMEILKEKEKIVHFRFATVGEKNAELTHPFETLHHIIFHSGTWYKWEKFLYRIKKDPTLKQHWLDYNKTFRYNPNLISDSKLIAFSFYLTEKEITPIDILRKVMNVSGKFIIIDKKKNKIMFHGGFHHDDGKKFSSLEHEPDDNLLNKFI